MLYHHYNLNHYYMDADVITIIITLFHHYNHYYMDEIKSSWWFPGKLVLFKDLLFFAVGDTMGYHISLRKKLQDLRLRQPKTKSLSH